MTVDHIIPRARGGTNFPWNLNPLCGPCNRQKADKIPTCQCERCQDAILMHWQYLMELPHLEQNALVLKVMSLYENRWESTS